MKTRTRWILGLSGLLPLAGTIVLSFLMRGEAGALLTPVFGPWAGLLFGHSDCTLGNVAPLPSLALAAFGALSLAGAWLRRGRRGQAALLVCVLTWAAGWDLAALLSVANTLS